MAVKMLQAEIAGNEKRLEILKQQQRITQLTAEYQRQGLEDAEARAKLMVALEKQLEDMQEKQTRLLEGIGANTKRTPTIQVTGNVDAVISR